MCPNRQSGFSLVEVALAMLVFAVGILTIIGLFPEGLRLNKRSIDDTRMALFADEVMGGYLAWSSVDAWDAWQSRSIDALAVDVWENSNDLAIESGTNLVNRYRPKCFPDLEDYVVSFRVDVDDIGGGRAKYIRLEAKNGEFNAADPEVFYTEIYYTGNP